MSASLHAKIARRGGVERHAAAVLSEVFAAHPSDGAATGFVLSRLPERGTAPVLWVRDRLTAREAGLPYLLPLSGGVIEVVLSNPRDVLIAVEEGLRCPALAAVVAEIWGDPKALDFTATKRLAIRAEAARIPCWLIRRGATANLSAARDRWRVGSLASAAHPDDPLAPGAPRWQVELFRSRDKRPGAWVIGDDRAMDPVIPLAPTGAAEPLGATG